MLRKLWIVFALALVVALRVTAEERVLTIDPAQSTVRFTLGATLHTVHGTFKVIRGEVRFAAVPGPARGEVVVDATSGETGNDSRDTKMHKEVLASARFPEIVLAIGSLGGEAAAGDRGTVTVEGTVRLCGAEHRVKIPVEVERSGDSVRLSATFVVPYVEWGLEDPSVFVLRVDKQVTVEVEARGTLSAAPAAAEPGAPSSP